MITAVLIWGSVAAFGVFVTFLAMSQQPDDVDEE